MKKTPLHESHKELKAKMGEFAGYDMPLYYGEGVIAEHEWVRSHAGLFDVSHMGQVMVEGPGTQSFFERLTPSSFAKAPAGRAKYTVLTNEQGGIVDDLIVTKLSDERFFTVINAGCKDKDIAWMQEHLPDAVRFDYWEGRALLALQGPESEDVLREVFGVDTSGMPYMWMMEGDAFHVSRLGYTGEDGFELSIPAEKAEEVWRKLLAHDAVKPVGLAARDSLRLEMGYCLYGHDIDAQTSPVEAGLSWVMGRENDGFIGAAVILPQKESGPDRQRIGVRLLDKGIAREGAVILNEEGAEIGHMTSGSFSPTLQEAIGQGYVEKAYAEAGRKIFVEVRGRKIAAVLAAMPFMPARTKSMKKQAA